MVWRWNCLIFCDLAVGPVERTCELLHALSAGIAQQDSVQLSDLSLLTGLVEQLLGACPARTCVPRPYMHPQVIMKPS